MSAGSEFTDSERAALAPYFTNLDLPVFALINLPETVKGALFARYSRALRRRLRRAVDLAAALRTRHQRARTEGRQSRHAEARAVGLRRGNIGRRGDQGRSALHEDLQRVRR